MTQNQPVCPGKAPRESQTEQVQILSQGSLNGYKRLFGGKLIPAKTSPPPPSTRWNSNPPPMPMIRWF